MKQIITCECCKRELCSWKALSSHIRQFHNISSKEYYDSYLKKDGEGICPVCGNATNFASLTSGYYICCSSNCTNKYDVRNKKISNTLKQNVEHIEKSKERLIAYNKSERGRKKSSEIGKVQGPLSMKNAHKKYDKVKWCDKCKQDTTHIIGIGCVSCQNKSEKHKLAVIQGVKNKYGEQYDNVFQVEEIKDAIKKDSMEKYGCENPGNSREARIKAAQTMRQNDNDSSWEDYFEIQLQQLNIPYEKKYGDNRYPFLCDFYLPKSDTFVEINGFWSHGKHWFDKDNINDVKTLDIWKEKAAEGQKQYANAINVWTIKDVKKYNYAKENNLNYVVLWSMDDIENYIKELTYEVE